MPNQPNPVTNFDQVNINTSLQVGSGGPISAIEKFSPDLTPVAVAADTSAEQTFAVAGLNAGDTVVVNPQVAQTDGIGIVGVRVSAANTLAIMFSNSTAGALTPAAGVYNVLRFAM